MVRCPKFWKSRRNHYHRVKKLDWLENLFCSEYKSKIDKLEKENKELRKRVEKLEDKNEKLKEEKEKQEHKLKSKNSRPNG